MKSAGGAKEPEPTAQAVGIAGEEAKAPQGRYKEGARLRRPCIAPSGARSSLLRRPTAYAVGSGSFAPSALFGTVPFPFCTTTRSVSLAVPIIRGLAGGSTSTLDSRQAWDQGPMLWASEKAQNQYVERRGVVCEVCCVGGTSHLHCRRRSVRLQGACPTRPFVRIAGRNTRFRR